MLSSRGNDLSFLVDTHVHLCDEAFREDRDRVCLRAKDARVELMVNIAESRQRWDEAGLLAERCADIFTVVGVHPHEADRYADQTALDALKKDLVLFGGNPRVVALGETGLDHYRQLSDASNQRKLFRIHCEAAGETGLPLVIHCRDVYDELIGLLTEMGLPRRDGARGVIHCFSGDTAQASALCVLGFKLGIDGPVTYPKADMLRDVVQQTALADILLETDSPYLPPQGFRGKRNEPMHLTLVSAAVAATKGIAVEEVWKKTTENAMALFKLPIGNELL